MKSLFIFLLMHPISIWGQNYMCNNLPCVLTKAEKLIKNKKYDKAMINLIAANGYPYDKQQQQRIDSLMLVIANIAMKKRNN